jgi:hypothetical protein
VRVSLHGGRELTCFLALDGVHETVIHGAAIGHPDQTSHKVTVSQLLPVG